MEDHVEGKEDIARTDAKDGERGYTRTAKDTPPRKERRKGRHHGWTRRLNGRGSDRRETKGGREGGRGEGREMHGREKCKKERQDRTDTRDTNRI